jgi:hypothetical protein
VDGGRVDCGVRVVIEVGEPLLAGSPAAWTQAHGSAAIPIVALGQQQFGEKSAVGQLLVFGDVGNFGEAGPGLTDGSSDSSGEAQSGTPEANGKDWGGDGVGERVATVDADVHIVTRVRAVRTDQPELFVDCVRWLPQRMAARQSATLQHVDRSSAARVLGPQNE